MSQTAIAIVAAAILAAITAVVIFAGSAMIRGANDSHDVAILHSAAASAIAEAQNAGSVTVSISSGEISLRTAPPYPHERTFDLPAPLTGSQPLPLSFTVSSAGVVTGLPVPVLTLTVDRTTETLYANQPFAFSP